MNLPVRQTIFREISTFVGLVATVILIAWFTLEVFSILMVIFSGIVLSLPLISLAKKISIYTPLSYRPALALALSVLSCLTLGIGILIYPALTQQLNELQQELPEAFNALLAYVEGFQGGQFIVEQIRNPETFLGRSSTEWNDFFIRLTDVFSNTLAIIGTLFVIVIVSLYVAVEPRMYVRGLLRLVPSHLQRRARMLLDDIAYTLRWWFFGQCISMSILGLSVTILLSILDIPLALLFGTFTALMTFIPNFGPFIAGIPTILIALSIDPTKGLIVFICLLALQMFEGNFLTPYIHRKTIALPPLLILSSQIILATLVGAIGVILAMPILVVIMVLVQQLYIRDILDKSPPKRLQKVRRHKAEELKRLHEHHSANSLS